MPLMKEIKFAVAQEPKVLITFKDAGTLLAVSRSRILPRLFCVSTPAMMYGIRGANSIAS